MTLRSVTELFAEVCATALVACSLAMIVILYLLATGTMP
jgi:hypothetical protein